MVTKVTGYERPMLLFGLSTDTKPVDVLNGSMFVEMDKSKYYLFVDSMRGQNGALILINFLCNIVSIDNAQCTISQKEVIVSASSNTSTYKKVTLG